jgi:hypothetical protein
VSSSSHGNSRANTSSTSESEKFESVTVSAYDRNQRTMRKGLNVISSGDSRGDTSWRGLPNSLMMCPRGKRDGMIAQIVNHPRGGEQRREFWSEVAFRLLRSAVSLRDAAIGVDESAVP